MLLSFYRIAVGAVAASAIVMVGVPACASVRELATAKGMIVISGVRTGLRAPMCSELLVEARDALDNHLIAETQPTIDELGTCQYALSVPAQTAVWLRLLPTLVAGVRVTDGATASTAGAGHAHPSSGSVALRFTVIAPTTYFFAPGENKTIRLSY